MTGVVSLADRKLKPVAEIVEKLEELLAQAKSGQIRELCFIVQLAGAAGYSNWASATDDAARQLGQVHRLAHRLQRAMDRVMNNGKGE